MKFHYLQRLEIDCRLLLVLDPILPQQQKGKRHFCYQYVAEYFATDCELLLCKEMHQY